MDTKRKIIALATKQFNQKGFGAVSLQELAQIVGISRGNLTYHFKSKDLLLEAIANQMWAQLEQERSKTLSFPSFENLHHQVQMYYQFQKTYAFIFLDTHVLNHPKIKKRFRALTEQTINDNKAKLAYAIQTGNLQAEPFPGVYDSIAHTTWMLTFYWHSQQIVRGEEVGTDGEKMIWSMIRPYLTDKGLAAFKTFFGESYFNALGETFDPNLNQLIAF